MLPDGTDAQVYGTGTNLDQLVTAGAELTYNVPHWKFGLEYTLSSAWYGSLNASNGKIQRYSCRMQQPHCCCCHVHVLISLYTILLIIYLSPVTDYCLMI